MNYLDPSNLREISRLQALQRKRKLAARKERKRCKISFVACYCVATTAALMALTAYILTR